MPTRERSDRDLIRALTGLVVESLSVSHDVTDGTVRCGQCENDRLTVGDPVVVGVTCYEGHSWELQDVYCADHAVESVAAAMPIRAEDQAVASATLEAAGYHSPDGRFHPDALTLGGVTVLDYSPPADGY
ncbi:hypothetical protein BRC83_07800 [Halobacteriales archaeon QS_1_68_17]|nr:MAG: hypothetical protein BRC83_07800 [Halobacteriales archaeon QS_1_68_17]